MCCRNILHVSRSWNKSVDNIECDNQRFEGKHTCFEKSVEFTSNIREDERADCAKIFFK